MFAGMRESEAFALWCGDVSGDGIQIERSWYKGRYEPPKTRKSERKVGVPDEILARLFAWIGRLPANGPKDCVFPSSTLVTPIWPESVLRMYVRPKLRPFELGWINFAVLRRSHSCLQKAEELGPQDHRRSTGSPNAHTPGQLRPERGGRTEGGSVEAIRRLYWGASQTRLIEVDAFWRGLQVVDSMERETGLEPATSSLGSWHSPR
jgi:hypothetical protein